MGQVGAPGSGRFAAGRRRPGGGGEAGGSAGRELHRRFRNRVKGAGGRAPADEEKT